MSRRKCVEGAHALAQVDLIRGQRLAGQPPPDEAEVEAYAAWQAEEERRNAQVKASQAALKAMRRVHLQRFMPELGELEAYTDIMYLVERGIAYHHGGMLPVLREFVELCFQQRLIMLVFATETLAVGVNMPARSVVFSQLDKPNDGDLAGHRHYSNYYY